ncbi:response regulator transcription factor [Nocardia bovistercoris]|uniref:Response regulator transcription factor n=1 Tax=Nocardia bovistercoris TaxID=2785916 RepID=A0A931IB96_9NOCA|nr:response regulator transcription factor [Nocardia bovistercoris]MBH0778422.1 response regulator transcription factor [Nocardia bovistercoris]
MRILVADDDPVVREVVRRYLERDGLTVVETADGASTAAALADDGADRVELAVLDVMMPAPDGIELCRAVRAGERPDMPIILLTALGEEDDRVVGLEAGADDYVTKPFSPRELALRVASVLRRSRAAPSPDRTALCDGPIRLRPAARAASVGDAVIELTPREFDLLEFLLRHPDTVFTREELLAGVWGWDFGDLSTVTVHVKRLRAKLGDNHRLHTVWGRGYAWRRDDAEPAHG